MSDFKTGNMASYLRYKSLDISYKWLLFVQNELVFILTAHQTANRDLLKSKGLLAKHEVANNVRCSV